MAIMKPIKTVRPGSVTQLLQSVVFDSKDIEEYKESKMYNPNDKVFVVKSNNITVFKCIDTTTGAFDTTKWVKNAIEIPELLWGSIKNTPITLSGYGITDGVRPTDLIDIDTRGSGRKSQAEGFSTADSGLSHSEGVYSKVSSTGLPGSGDIVLNSALPTSFTGFDSTNLTLPTTKSYTFNKIDMVMAKLLIPTINSSASIPMTLLYARSPIGAASIAINATISEVGETIVVSFTVAMPSNYSRLSSLRINASLINRSTAGHSEGILSEASNIASHAEGFATLASGRSSHAQGESTIASGLFAHAEGMRSVASGEGSHASGYSTTASGQYSYTGGYMAVASGFRSFSHGETTKAIGSDAVAFGYRNETYSNQTLVTGSNNNVGRGADNSTSEGTENFIGFYANILAKDIATSTLTLDTTSHSFEVGNTVMGDASGYSRATITAVAGAALTIDNISFIAGTKLYLLNGSDTNFAGGSHVEGRGNIASKMFSHVEGNYNIATGHSSHAEGSSNVVSGQSAHVEGSSNKAIGDFSHAEGSSTISEGNYAHAEGLSTRAYGYASSSSGGFTYSVGKFSRTSGYGTIALTDYSYAEGLDNVVAPNGVSTTVNSVDGINRSITVASITGFVTGSIIVIKLPSSYCYIDTIGAINGNTISLSKITPDSTFLDGIVFTTSNATFGGHAEGASNTLFGINAHVEGKGNIVKGAYAHAEGTNNIAPGQAAHVEGNSNEASGSSAHAEGSGTKATALSSHAEGSSTWASGSSSHAEGINTVSKGIAAHAEGSNTLAMANSSHAGGASTLAGSLNSHAQGFSSGAIVANALPILSTSSNVVTVESTALVSVGANCYIKVTDGSFVPVIVVSKTQTTITIDVTVGGTSWRYFIVPITTSPISTVSVSGINNVSVAQGGHVAGSNNLNTGANAHITGMNNTNQGLGSMMVGSYNYNTATNTIISGTSNTVMTGDSSIVTGMNNGSTYLANSILTGRFSVLTGTDSIVVGSGNIISRAADVNPHVESSALFGSYGRVTESNVLALGNGDSQGSPGLAFIVRKNGTVTADGAYSSAGADYAEYFEWSDGNPNNEDRVGIVVTFENGAFIRPATKDDKYILGVVSATPSIIGDDHNLRWKDKYLMDDWGRILEETIIVPESIIKIKETDPNTGEIVDKAVVQPQYEINQPVINPDWNPDQEYISRKDRKEFSPIGLLGKLKVKDDGTAEIGDYVYPNVDGIVTKSTDGFKVIARNTDNIITILMK